RTRSGRIGGSPDLLERGRPGGHQVVRHDVVVREDDLDRFAGLEDDAILVEEHLVGDGSGADHAYAELAEPRARRAPFIARKLRRQPFADLEPIEDRGRRALSRGDLLDPREDRVEQGADLLLRPVLARNSRQRTHRRATLDVLADEPSERPERSRFLAAHVSQSLDGGASHEARRPASAELDLGDRIGGAVALAPIDLGSPFVEDEERVAAEPLAEVGIGSVMDADRLDRHLVAKIDLPPRLSRVLARVGLGSAGIRSARVAIDGARRLAAMRGVLLGSDTAARDVPA